MPRPDAFTRSGKQRADYPAAGLDLGDDRSRCTLLILIMHF